MLLANHLRVRVTFAQPARTHTCQHFRCTGALISQLTTFFSTMHWSTKSSTSSGFSFTLANSLSLRNGYNFNARAEQQEQQEQSPHRAAAAFFSAACFSARLLTAASIAVFCCGSVNVVSGHKRQHSREGVQKGMGATVSAGAAAYWRSDWLLCAGLAFCTRRGGCRRCCLGLRLGLLAPPALLLPLLLGHPLYSTHGGRCQSQAASGWLV